MKFPSIQDPFPIQFFHALWVLKQYYCNYFEWNEKLLLFVLDSFYNSRYGFQSNYENLIYLLGNFFGDSIREHGEGNTSRKTLSIWSHVLSRAHRPTFSNPLWEPSTQPLLPQFFNTDVSAADLVPLWSSFFFRNHLDVIIGSLDYEENIRPYLLFYELPFIYFRSLPFSKMDSLNILNTKITG